MIFLLKLLRKLIGLFVKLVLLPFRIVLRLVGLRSGGDDGSSSAAGGTSAAASASATAAAGAAEAAEGRREESMESGVDTDGTRRLDAATRASYGRFRKALYAYAGLGALFYIFLWAEFGLAGQLPLVPMTVGAVIPAAVGYATRTRTRLAWGAGMAYAAVFLLVSVVSLGSFSTLGPSATRAFRDVLGGGVVMLLGLVSLLQIGALAAALYFGVTGRAVALGGASVEPSLAGTTSAPTGSDAGAPGSGESESASAGDPADGSAAASAASDAGAPAETDASDDQETTAAETTGPGAPTPTDTGSVAGAVSASGTAATADAPADDTGDEAAGADESDGESDTGADPAPEETGPSVVDLAERARSTRDPAVVRELGELAGDDIPDEVVAALEVCADADDPDVRVAVCEACATIDADETDAVLRQLRIDTNDRVATAAMAAY